MGGRAPTFTFKHVHTAQRGEHDMARANAKVEKWASEMGQSEARRNRGVGTVRPRRPAMLWPAGLSPGPAQVSRLGQPSTSDAPCGSAAPGSAVLERAASWLSWSSWTSWSAPASAGQPLERLPALSDCVSTCRRGEYEVAAELDGEKECAFPATGEYGEHGVRFTPGWLARLAGAWLRARELVLNEVSCLC